MAGLKTALSVMSLANKGWLAFGVLAFMTSVIAGSYAYGRHDGATRCETARQKSKTEAVNRASKAASEIANVRIKTGRQHAEIKEAFNDVRKWDNKTDQLQAEIIANNCNLSADRLRDINQAILRTRDPD